MITRVSGFIDRKTREAARTDDLRPRVLVRLCQSRLSVEDIALAFNCSESIVRSLLARPLLSLLSGEGTSPACPIEPINLEAMPQMKRAVGLKSGPGSSEDAACDQEKHARLLAMEIRRWLCTFGMTDTDRQYVIERAGLLLDNAERNSAGEYVFDVSRTVLDALGIWGPKPFLTGDREFRTLVGRWLTSWIHFWIADPVVSNRALDLEYAYFAEQAQAA
jgi:hypothetical protein